VANLHVFAEFIIGQTKLKEARRTGTLHAPSFEK
jgi:hypothetical protein